MDTGVGELNTRSVVAEVHRDPGTEDWRFGLALDLDPQFLLGPDELLNEEEDDLEESDGDGVVGEEGELEWTEQHAVSVLTVSAGGNSAAGVAGLDCEHARRF